MTSRRTFLAQMSMAGAVGAAPRISRRALWRMTAGELLGEPNEVLLRSLALAAVEAARAAGATFADIRIAAGRDMGFSCLYRAPGPTQTGPGSIESFALNQSRTDGFGVRAIVDGAWGFVGGTELALDAVADAARRAVALARANQSRRRQRIELAPAPRVANGDWTSPMERDPLTVPYEEMREVGLDALSALSKDGIHQAHVAFSWRRPTTVFASTEDTFVLQRHCQGGVGGEVYCGDEEHRVSQGTRGRFGAYGYESVDQAGLAPALREAAARAVALVSAARSPMPTEVGRYDIVFGAEAAGRILAETKSVDELGGSQASETVSVLADMVAISDPLQLAQSSTVEAVPFRARHVNVLNIGRTA